MPPKRKGKGRAAEPTSHDDFVEAASYQEDQATRYQFGEKAQRHYEEALRLYGAALQIPGLTQEEQYDDRYNLGRVLYALATEIYGPPQCYETLSQAIDAFRGCDAYSVADKTDAAFNLAQALQTLGEYANEGTPSSSSSFNARPEAIWAEARQILEAVWQEQMSRLSRSDFHATASSPTAVNDDDELVNDTGLTAETAAIEEQVVTASTVIETIITAIQADVSIAEITQRLDEEDITRLLQSAANLDSEGGYMAGEILSAHHEVLKTRTRLQLEHGEAPNMEDMQSVIEQQRQASAAQRRPDPAQLSDLADSLVLAAEALLATSTSSDNPAAVLNEALTLYGQARAILSNPLQRPSTTPAHHVNALLSANCQSCAHAYTLLAILASRAVIQDDAYMSRAKELALEGLNRVEGVFKALPAGNDGLVKFGKNLRSAQREDYRTVSATRDSVLNIVRMFLLERLIQGGSQLPGEQARGLQALLRAVWPDANVLKYVLEEYVNDIQMDGVGRLCKRILGTSEQDSWAVFVNASL